MVSITLSVPEETRKVMKRFPEVNWSGFIRKKIEQKASELEWKEEMLEKLKAEENLIEGEVELGREINEGIARRLKKEGLA